MTRVTLDSPFKSAPRISREKWLSVWQSRYPTALQPQMPLWRTDSLAYTNFTPTERVLMMYDGFVEAGHDPAVWLAIGCREHQLGTDQDSVLWRNDTRSLTNARTIRMRGIPGRIITDSKRGSTYVQYVAVEHSVADGVFRIEEKGYVYQRQGRDTIGKVFGPGGWTEDPEEYGQFVVDIINQWIAEEEAAGVSQSPTWEQYQEMFPEIIDLRSYLPKAPDDGLPRGPWGRSDWREKEGIVVHWRGAKTDTSVDGRLSFKADANYHIGKNWAAKGDVPIYGTGIMYHLGVDFHGNLYLLRDFDLTLWHCGASQNATALAIQVCLGPGQTPTFAMLATLDRTIERWLKVSHSPRSSVWGHSEVGDSDCPGPDILAWVRAFRNRQVAQPPQHESVRAFDVDGWGTFTVAGGFLRYWEAFGALEEFGYPLTNEFTEDGKVVQYFERARFEWHPGVNPQKWDVLLGRLGAEVYERRYLTADGGIR